MNNAFLMVSLLEVQGRVLIRAVNLRVTISALGVVIGNLRWIAKGAAAAVRPRVALHAQERLVLDKQVILNRAMRIVADSAILSHGRMLECERPDLIRMASEACLRHGFLSEQSIRPAVRIMATAASDLPLLKRMVGGHLALDFLVFVAVEADIRLGGSVEFTLLALQLRLER